MSTETVNTSPASTTAVQQILTEMVDISTELFDQKDDLIAKGVPQGDVNKIVDAGRRSDHEELTVLRARSLSASREKFGVGAISEQAFDDYVDRISELASDLMHVRKMAKGLDLNLDAINLLTQTIRENPGDQGSALLTDVVGYARSYGITVGNIQLVSVNDKPVNTSVLPDVHKPEAVSKGLWQYRDVIVEASLGIGVAFVALWLMT